MSEHVSDQSLLTKDGQLTGAVFTRLYAWLVLNQPKCLLFAFLLLISFLFVQLKDFSFDASGDSLLLEDDVDLSNYRALLQHYPSSDDYLVVVYQNIQGDIFNPKTLDKLTDLKAKLLALPGVTGITSVLDVPILDHPSLDVTNVSNFIYTLDSKLTKGQSGYPEERWQRIKSYFTSHPLYNELLVSKDGKTTAMQVVIQSNTDRSSMVYEREALRKLKKETGFRKDQAKRLNELDELIKTENASDVKKNQKIIEQVRAVLTGYNEPDNLVFLGGVPLIVVDMMRFVKSDLKQFGGTVVLFLIVTLAVIFKRKRWVLISLFCCIVSSLSLSGLLAWTGFPVTVISSNYVSLIFIISMSMIIHLIVHYRELALSHREEFLNLPDRDSSSMQRKLVLQTVKDMFWPIFYTALTTVVAFLSLILSKIRPIIDFGIMMSMGIGLAFFIAFVIFPAIMMLLRPVSAKQRSQRVTDVDDVDHHPISLVFLKITEKLGDKLIWIALGVLIVSAIGVSRLTVENRFIDYFKESSEIHQGMKLIDEEMGGTTPLEIVIRFPELSLNQTNIDDAEEDEDCFIDDDCLEDVYGESQLLTVDRVALANDIQSYLSSLKGIGKVLSVATTMDMLEDINGKPLNSVELALVGSMFPDEFKSILLLPYVHFDRNEFRFNLRILDTDKTLVRAELIDTIRSGLQEKFGLKEDQILITGMLVMYNNMLQSLFSSQIKTLGFVFLGILLMFFLIFRSIKVALVGIFPNILSAIIVLGIMGWLGIPLDIMTITIAAITVGIAVDDTIHYIYRFREEYQKTNDYKQAMLASHASIGKAMYYTSATIIVGFSVLMMSSFSPTLYFGLFTSLAMLIALISALTLLPQLMIKFHCVD